MLEKIVYVVYFGKPSCTNVNISNRHIVSLRLEEHLSVDNAVSELPPQQHLLLLQLGQDATVLSSTSVMDDAETVYFRYELNYRERYGRTSLTGPYGTYL